MLSADLLIVILAIGAAAYLTKMRLDAHVKLMDELHSMSKDQFHAIEALHNMVIAQADRIRLLEKERNPS